MPLRLGIDIACRAAHQVSLADEQGRFIWTGRRFRTTPQDLARLWAMLPDGTDPAEVLVVMEPTRNAWVPLAAWFRRRGAGVVLVPPERSADLRRYYAKHTKSDRLDSQLLARLPMLHPDGLYAEQGLGPGDALKRAAKLHSTLTHRRSQSLARLDALLEILGPAWHAAIGADLANRTPLKFLAAGYADPHVVKRLGRTRLARFCYRHSRGAWGEPHADALLAAAQETLQLWSGGELDYPDLAEDIAIEARLALQLTEEIKDLDERTALLLREADPTGILTSAPGVAAITAAAILGRLGDPNRFTSLAGARAFTGLVPTLDASGLNGRHGGTDQTRRRGPAASTVHGRRPGPPHRPHPGRQIPPPHDRGRQTPQLRALPHRHHAADPDHRLLARRTALPAARRRRHPSDHRTSPRDHRRTLHHTQRPPRPTQNHHRHRNGPAKQGVAKRSINRSVQTQRYDPHRSLTSVRNSTGSSLHRPVRPKGRGGAVRPDLPRERDPPPVDRAGVAEPEREGGKVPRHPAAGLLRRAGPFASLAAARKRWMAGWSDTTPTVRTRPWMPTSQRFQPIDSRRSRDRELLPLWLPPTIATPATLHRDQQGVDQAPDASGPGRVR